jgi:hypothetical protein
MEQDTKYLQLKWTPMPRETKEAYKARREEAIKVVAPQWAEKMNVTYGPFDPEVDDIRGYEAKDFMESMGMGEVEPRAPLTTDLVTFVLWLREHTDFFSGPNLDLHYPQATDPAFHETLAQLALLYTEE